MGLYQQSYLAGRSRKCVLFEYTNYFCFTLSLTDRATISSAAYISLLLEWALTLTMTHLQPKVKSQYPTRTKLSHAALKKVCGVTASMQVINSY